MKYAPITYIATESGIAAVIEGEQYTITSDNPSYPQVLDAIKQQIAPALIADLFNQANAIKRYLKGGTDSGRNKVEIDVENGELFFNGEQIHNYVVDRILEFIAEGLSPQPLINFLERLLANPSRRAVEELYKFLEHGKMPITPQGTFLSYKGVQDNYMDVHSGNFDNRPGSVHEMKRNLVCDDARKACSNGFHVGSLEYATKWGPRTVIVEVDPADVVSVPLDSGCQKLRTAKYKVVCDFKGAMNRAVARQADPYGDY